MRAITVRQPWASLLFAAGARKVFETRGYQPRCVSIGDEIAIHAGSVVDVDAITLPVFRKLSLSFQYDEQARSALAKRLPVGQIIGLARLTAILPADQAPFHQQIFGDFSAGRFAWGLKPTLRLAPGIVCRGQLGLWPVPELIEKYLIDARRSA